MFKKKICGVATTVLLLLSNFQCCFGYEDFKVPTREIFVTELFTLIDPIWKRDMRIEPKKLFVQSVRLIFAILFFYR